MMSGIGNSHSIRLFFWFFWLGGFLLGLFLIGQFLSATLVQDNLQKATPYFLGFVWQCFVQLAALKSYQYSTQLRQPLVIQLAGSLALILIVATIFLIKS